MKIILNDEAMPPAPFTDFMKGSSGGMRSAHHLVQTEYPAVSRTLCGVRLAHDTDYWGEPGAEVDLCDKCAKAATK